MSLDYDDDFDDVLERIGGRNDGSAGLGIASFVIALHSSASALAVAVVWCLLMEEIDLGDFDPDDRTVMVANCGILTVLGLGVLGIILGAVGLWTAPRQGLCRHRARPNTLIVLGSGLALFLGVMGMLDF